MAKLAFVPVRRLHWRDIFIFNKQCINHIGTMFAFGASISKTHQYKESHPWERFPNAADVLFLLLGAIMILAMHAGFAFLELGTVRKKNQVNALAKILSDFAVSAIAYFAVGYSVAYGVNFCPGQRADRQPRL